VDAVEIAERHHRMRMRPKLIDVANYFHRSTRVGRGARRMRAGGGAPRRHLPH
jgi:hypothetical protein